MPTLAPEPVETKPLKTKNTSDAGGRRATAESMAARQRDISVSEFFAKNRHLLGFDNPRKALLTTVKEAVDNALDASEEAGILPDITVVIEDLQPERGREVKASRYRVTVIDNGPGIVRKQVENIFGRLLYGSKFHRLKMSRGQQGIGISAAGMYGLITTGKPMVIHTRPSAHKPAHHIELAMNTKTNRAEVTVDDETQDFPPARFRTLTPGTRELTDKGELLSTTDYSTGTSVSIELEGRYQRGRGSVDEFLELTAIANPHARITFVPPSRESAAETEEELEFGKKGKGKGAEGPKDQGTKSEGASEGADASTAAPVQTTTETSGVIVFPRGVSELPPETKEIQPHPKGIELGILLQMLKESEAEASGLTLYTFLQEKFSRVSAQSAAEFCKAIGATSRTKVADIDHAQAEKLFAVLQDSKLPPPPTDCLAPIGVQQLLKGMFKGVRAEFYAASSRQAEVYRGRPFLIEAAIAFGGELATEDSARVIRFANRVPLLFQQSACSSFKAVSETNWRNYDLQQPRGAVPVGPLVIMIHMASVWVPFTSESKEAIADYDEIRKEMKLALMECGRKLGTYLRKRLKMRRESERRDVFERYIGEISKAVNSINGVETDKIYKALLDQARKRTAIADLQLDDEGKKVADTEATDEDGVLIVAPEPEPQLPNAAKAGKGDPFTPSKSEAARLKVAAMSSGDDDDDGKLIDTAPVRRSSKAPKGKASAPAARAHASESTPRGKGKPAASQPSAAVESKPSRAPQTPAPAASAGGKAPKPRTRLVNGKLVPVDEGPKLF